MKSRDILWAYISPNRSLVIGFTVKFASPFSYLFHLSEFKSFIALCMQLIFVQDILLLFHDPYRVLLNGNLGNFICFYPAAKMPLWSMPPCWLLCKEDYPCGHTCKLRFFITFKWELFSIFISKLAPDCEMLFLLHVSDVMVQDHHLIQNSHWNQRKRNLIIIMNVLQGLPALLAQNFFGGLVLASTLEQSGWCICSSFLLVCFSFISFINLKILFWLLLILNKFLFIISSAVIKQVVMNVLIFNLITTLFTF